MDIESLSSIAELIAAIATLATLIYLTIQIRQTSASLKTTAVSNYSQMWVNSQFSLAESDVLPDIWWRGLESPDSLSTIEWQRFQAFLSAILHVIEQGYEFSREGAISESIWNSERNRLVYLCKQPGFLKFWSTWGPLRGPDFAGEVNGIIAEIGNASGT